MEIKINNWIKYDKFNLNQIIILFLSQSNDFYFDLYKYVYINKFIKKKDKEEILDSVRIAQSNRFILTKFFKNLYWKLYKKNIIYKNDSDLMLNPLLEKNNYPYLIENFKIYRFSKTDVRNLFKNSLLYSKFRKIKILDIKNPYNNRILSKYELYNLYIQCYENNYMPWIIKEFAKIDFDKTIFKKNFRSYLDLKAVKIDIKDFTDDELLKEADYCFKTNIVNFFNNIKYFPKYKYNGLKHIPIEAIRLFFNPILIDNYFHNTVSDYKYVKPYKLSIDFKKRLLKFWSLYPWILKSLSDNILERKVLENIMINKLLNNNNTTTITYNTQYEYFNDYDYELE